MVPFNEALSNFLKRLKNQKRFVFWVFEKKKLVFFNTSFSQSPDLYTVKHLNLIMGIEHQFSTLSGNSDHNLYCLRKKTVEKLQKKNSQPKNMFLKTHLNLIKTLANAYVHLDQS